MAGMYLRNYGNHQLFRPDHVAEARITRSFERSIRSKFEIGTYSDIKTINNILHHCFAFFENKIGKFLPYLASRDFLQFVLYQYELSALIHREYISGKLTVEESEEWRRLEPVFRRSCKYILEMVTLIQPGESASVGSTIGLPMTNELWSCAEQAVEFYLMSDQIYMVSPDGSTMTLLPPGNHPFLTADTRQFPGLHEAIKEDREFSDRYISDSYDFDFSAHDTILGSSFLDFVGVKYKEAIGIIEAVYLKCEPAKDGFPVFFIHRSGLIERAHELTGLPIDALERSLNGFTITKEHMEAESRVVYRPKQEYRALRRGFFRMAHATGDHLAFSKEMAKENLINLINSVVFQKFPREWINEDISNRLSKISNLAGEWFEDIVYENLRVLGFVGLKSLESYIGQGALQVTIPEHVGEIDILGYFPNRRLFLVAECKMVGASVEGNFFRGDLSDFVLGNNSYHEKFLRKQVWVKENIVEICKALEVSCDFNDSVIPNRIASVMVTYYPCIAQWFINEYPCINLTQLMRKCEANDDWPFETGVENL